jgi:hypothetical protein
MADKASILRSIISDLLRFMAEREGFERPIELPYA